MQGFKFEDSFKVVRRGNENFFKERTAVCYGDNPDLFRIFTDLFTFDEIVEKCDGATYIPF